MSIWIFWMVGAVLSGVVYNIGMKLGGAQIPIWSYLILAGVSLVVLGLVFYFAQGAATRWDWLNQQSLKTLFLIVAALVFLEVSMFNMYYSGAPLSISRVVSTTSSLVILTLAGVLLFKEVLTPIQMAGVVFAIISSVMVIWK